jgi:hypothetical protein
MSPFDDANPKAFKTLLGSAIIAANFRVSNIEVRC